MVNYGKGGSTLSLLVGLFITGGIESLRIGLGLFVFFFETDTANVKGHLLKQSTNNRTYLFLSQTETNPKLDLCLTAWSPNEQSNSQL